mmetsp:Transcript_7237/g.21326  ORF Transcript_7237/g.21326 Transcript_7237/m.21326 type:complete len:228 (-) Transcript_7237:200-883(-)
MAHVLAAKTFTAHVSIAQALLLSWATVAVMTSEILVSEHGAGAVSALESARDASGSAPVTLNAALTALKSIAVALEAGLCVLEGALVVLESALATLALDTCVWAAVHKPATTGRAFVAGEGHTAVGPPVTAEVDGCPCNLLGRSADILFHVAAMACLRAVCAGGGAAAMEPSVVLVIDGEASQPPRRTATTPVSTAVCTAVSTAVAGHSALVAGALITVLYTVVAVA